MPQQTRAPAPREIEAAAVVRSASVEKRTCPPRPVLRWVGGKQFLLPALLEKLPPDMSGRRYYEPFLGAASLFLAVKPVSAFLSDANPHLISAYEYVRDKTTRVANYLADLAASHSIEQYYRVRTTYNRSRPSAAQAARFIYLNRTCFNGIFRVNKRGEFNVPHGSKEHPWFPDKNDLRALALAHHGASLGVADYRMAVHQARRGDFVYLDPPYPALNGTSNFAHYTMDRFDLGNQRELAAVYRALDRRGCLVMMSNADIPLIRELYAPFRMVRFDVRRFVSCKSVKQQVGELIITNYK